MANHWVVLASLVAAFGWCPTARAEQPPPPYVAPTQVNARFDVASASVVLTDARRERHPVQLNTAGLSSELAARMKPNLADSRGAIVLRVKVIEAREVSESPPVVRAIVEISVERDAKVLVSTRGTSTLHGSLGGMTPQTEERVRSALLDAFERSVLRAGFIDATNAALATPAEPSAPPPVARVPETNTDWTIAPDEAFAQAHVVSIVFDGGKTYAFGARYLHDHVYGSSGVTWAGYGVEGRFISDDGKRLDATAGLAVVHAGFAAEQGFSVEFGFGGGGRNNVRPIGVVGAYLSFYYVDLGFTYQFVIAPSSDLRPLSGPHFGVRLNVPVNVHAFGARCHSPSIGPCRPSLLAGFNAPKSDER